MYASRRVLRVPGGLAETVCRYAATDAPSVRKVLSQMLQVRQVVLYVMLRGRLTYFGTCYSDLWSGDNVRDVPEYVRRDCLLKMDYNGNSHIKLTIEPCLCCVQVTIYCCGHMFFSL